MGREKAANDVAVMRMKGWKEEMDGRLADITRQLAIYKDGDAFEEFFEIHKQPRRPRFTIVDRKVLDLGDEESSSDSEENDQIVEVDQSIKETMTKNGPQGALMRLSLMQLGTK